MIKKARTYAGTLLSRRKREIDIVTRQLLLTQQVAALASGEERERLLAEADALAQMLRLLKQTYATACAFVLSTGSAARGSKKRRVLH